MSASDDVKRDALQQALAECPRCKPIREELERMRRSPHLARPKTPADGIEDFSGGYSEV